MRKSRKRTSRRRVSRRRVSRRRVSRRRVSRRRVSRKRTSRKLRFRAGGADWPASLSGGVWPACLTGDPGEIAIQNELNRKEYKDSLARAIAGRVAPRAPQGRGTHKYSNPCPCNCYECPSNKLNWPNLERKFREIARQEKSDSSVWKNIFAIDDEKRRRRR